MVEQQAWIEALMESGVSVIQLSSRTGRYIMGATSPLVNPVIVADDRDRRWMAIGKLRGCFRSVATCWPD
jgi:hypothetical protein